MQLIYNLGKVHMCRVIMACAVYKVPAKPVFREVGIWIPNSHFPEVRFCNSLVRNNNSQHGNSNGSVI